MSIIAIMLCALILDVKATGVTNQTSSSKTADCECCKNCKDEKCKELCKKWSSMTADERKGEEGKKVKEECIKICKEKKCCSSSDKNTCEAMMEGKSCCKKK